jgi:hypothetical protein
MLNLILGCTWLITGLTLLTYEFFNGPTGFRIRGLDVSMGWFFMAMAAWNFVRWYSSRAWRAEQAALRAEHEARLRQARYHERPLVPDPTFDFTDKPNPPSNPNVTDQPPGGEPRT